MLVTSAWFATEINSGTLHQETVYAFDPQNDYITSGLQHHLVANFA
jgi:hypothetical protein